MKLYETPSGIEITLSRRNILALLHKLDWEDSERTLEKICDNGKGRKLITLVAEEDDDHYGDDIPGEMHPKTENFIKSYGGSE